MDELLAVNNLRQIFGTRHPTYAVDGISFSMPQQSSILNLVGESGSGKSTIARIILGLLRPTGGAVYFQGQDVYTAGKTWQQQFRREVQAVFQNPYAVYNPAYKIERVFQIPIRKFQLATRKDEARAKIEESLRSVDLRPEDVLGKFPHQLSGGQRQRVMLARLHLIRPRLIIADEAVSMVDAAGRVTFLNILLDFRDRYGISTLYITHDLSTAQYLGGNIIVLYKGRIVERGDTLKVTAEPLHPYAQLLIQSVPVPDPTRRWTEMLAATSEVAAVRSPRRDRCLFAERCPYVMDICWQVRPELQSVDNEAGASQEVACHKYGLRDGNSTAKGQQHL